MTELRKIELVIRRQAGPRAAPRGERFKLEVTPRTTVAEALDALALGALGDADPIAYTAGCLASACGSCAMLVLGRPLPACTTPLEDVLSKKGTLRLAPLTKFAIVRDLLVDRARLAAGAAQLGARSGATPFAANRAATLAAEHGPSRVVTAAEPPPSRSATAAEHAASRGTTIADHAPARAATLAERLALSRCTGCGACIEVCPETRLVGGFVGAAAVAAHRLIALAPASAEAQRDLALALTAPGGIHDCGDARACVEACPESLPLDDALASSHADASRAFWRGLVRR